jgi:hypothetical protein
MQMHESSSHTFHSKDANDLKESLHRAHEKMKQATELEYPDPWSGPELAKELSDIFVNALFLDDAEDDNPSMPRLTSEQMRDLVLFLDVDEMVEIIKHFELCESTNSPLRWDLIQSIIHPDSDEDDGNNVDVGRDDSCSYVMSDDGEDYEIVDLDDDNDNEAGFAIEACTASCNSSITGFWSLYSDEDDGSFAMDGEVEELIVDEEGVAFVYEE